MSNINLVQCQDADDAVSRASEKLNLILKDLAEHGVPTLLLLSGGSALKIAEQIEKNYLPKVLTLGVLDDRYSKDESVNNFSQLARTKLFRDAENIGAVFIDTRVNGEESIDEVAERADMAIKNWIAKNETGKIIITQGIGPDGHTSGVMPFPEDEEKFQKLFIDTEKYSVGYDAEGKNQYSLRITATLRFLMDKVDESVLLMTGAEKLQAFNSALDASGQLAHIPARVIHQMKKVNLFTDIKNS